MKAEDKFKELEDLIAEINASGESDVDESVSDSHKEAQISQHTTSKLDPILLDFNDSETDKQSQLSSDSSKESPSLTQSLSKTANHVQRLEKTTKGGTSHVDTHTSRKTFGSEAPDTDKKKSSELKLNIESHNKPNELDKGLLNEPKGALTINKNLSISKGSSQSNQVKDYKHSTDSVESAHADHTASDACSQKTTVSNSKEIDIHTDIKETTAEVPMQESIEPLSSQSETNLNTGDKTRGIVSNNEHNEEKLVKLPKDNENSKLGASNSKTAVLSKVSLESPKEFHSGNLSDKDGKLHSDKTELTNASRCEDQIKKDPLESHAKISGKNSKKKKRKSKGSQKVLKDSSEKGESNLLKNESRKEAKDNLDENDEASKIVKEALNKSSFPEFEMPSNISEVPKKLSKDLDKKPRKNSKDEERVVFEEDYQDFGAKNETEGSKSIIDTREKPEKRSVGVAGETCDDRTPEKLLKHSGDSGNSKNIPEVRNEVNKERPTVKDTELLKDHVSESKTSKEDSKVESKKTSGVSETPHSTKGEDYIPSKKSTDESGRNSSVIQKNKSDKLATHAHKESSRTIETESTSKPPLENEIDISSEKIPEPKPEESLKGLSAKVQPLGPKDSPYTKPKEDLTENIEEKDVSKESKGNIDDTLQSLSKDARTIVNSSEISDYNELPKEEPKEELKKEFKKEFKEEPKEVLQEEPVTPYLQSLSITEKTRKAADDKKMPVVSKNSESAADPAKSITPPSNSIDATLKKAPESSEENSDENTVYLYMSMASGVRGSMSRFNKATTILKSYNIDFIPVELTLNERAKRQWKYKGVAHNKVLPAVFRDNDLKCDFNELLEANEIEDVEDLIFDGL